MRRTVPLLLLAALCACATASPGPRAAPHEPDAAAVSGARGATVLTGDQLRGAGPTLLVALAGRVPNLRIERGAGCPTLRLRGDRTLTGTRDPLVYIDGGLVGSTCILESMRTAEIRQVEIYPTGNAPRGGYRSSPNGLILVFRVTEAGS